MQAREETISLEIIEENIIKIKEFRKVQDDMSIKDILLNNVRGYVPKDENRNIRD